MYSVYIKINGSSCITDINSSAFITDHSGWIEIDRGEGDRYHHAQGNYLDKPITTSEGFYQYKYIDGNVVERSAEEINIEYNSKNLNIIKNDKITESKIRLAEWLATHPIQFTDSKYYSVTEEKQSLLNGNLASYERATQAGIEYPLKWNSTGEECTDWAYNDLLTLSLNIAAYVAPKVSMQQNYEIQIRNCNNIEEIDSIVIDYD